MAEQNAIFVNRYERAVAAAILTGDSQYLNTLEPLRDNLVEQPYIIDRWVHTAQSAVGSDGSEIILLTAWLGACGATPAALSVVIIEQVGENFMITSLMLIISMTMALLPHPSNDFLAS